jgi:hypothetical protein
MASIFNSISSLVSNNITGTNEMAESNGAQLRSAEEAGKLHAYLNSIGHPSVQWPMPRQQLCCIATWDIWEWKKDAHQIGEEKDEPIL